MEDLPTTRELELEALLRDRYKQIAELGDQLTHLRTYLPSASTSTTDAVSLPPALIALLLPHINSSVGVEGEKRGGSTVAALTQRVRALQEENEQMYEILKEGETGMLKEEVQSLRQLVGRLEGALRGAFARFVSFPFVDEGLNRITPDDIESIVSVIFVFLVVELGVLTKGAYVRTELDKSYDAFINPPTTPSLRSFGSSSFQVFLFYHAHLDHDSATRRAEAISSSHSRPNLLPNATNRLRHLSSACSSRSCSQLPFNRAESASTLLRPKAASSEHGPYLTETVTERASHRSPAITLSYIVPPPLILRPPHTPLAPSDSSL
ncbi:hypothetical protein V5O48_016777 [Marasmius crinis-equi]|uniref:Uncharacterized protein n=1 Tax=Marasmius crinis-equi TaxID=585013 RepID=A0ABR3EQV0_9AGAR